MCLRVSARLIVTTMAVFGDIVHKLVAEPPTV